MKSIVQSIFLFVAFFSFFVACNREEETLPEEDYTKLFPIKNPETPYENYDDMVVYPCNPTEAELDFQYPGVEITDNVREYNVSLNLRFTERLYSNVVQHPHSRFEVRYIDENHKLVILRSYEHDGKPADIQNDKQLRIRLKAKSGYPLYLGVHGYGFNTFEIDIRMLARSTDGIITSPVFSYSKYLYRDGAVDIEPFCQKVILP